MEDPQPSSGDIASPTFAEAFASDEPDQTAAASPAPQTDPSAPPAPDTTVPGDGSDFPASDTGPIPFDRHQAILDRERRQREDLQQRYAWVPQNLDPQQGAAMLQWFTQAGRDPVAFLRQLEQELKAHPQFGSQLTAPEGEPPPDLTAENGEAVYSAKQQRAWAAWREAQIEARILKRFDPLMESHQQQQVQSEAERNVATALHEASDWEAFQELRPQIAELMRSDGRITLSSAYHRAHHTWAMDRDKRTREAVLAELQTKGNASTINPGKSTGTTPKNYQELGFGEALRDSGG